MAHRSIIVCDKCGTDSVVKGAPYPLRWGSIIMITHSKPEGGVLSTNRIEHDLCPDCFEKFKLGLSSQ